jgi:hypothetical protein
MNPMNFMKLNFNILRSSAQISGVHVRFFESLLSMRKHYFIYNGKTFLQLLINEKKNIIYIIMLLDHLLKTPEHHSIINHVDEHGLTAFIQMIILRPNQVKDVIRQFMSFPCFDKSITYKGKTAEDYINESLLEQQHKDKLLKILNPFDMKRKIIEQYCTVDNISEHNEKKRKNMDNNDLFAIHALLKMSKQEVKDPI